VIGRSAIPAYDVDISIETIPGKLQLGITVRKVISQTRLGHTSMRESAFSVNRIYRSVQSDNRRFRGSRFTRNRGNPRARVRPVRTKTIRSRLVANIEHRTLRDESMRACARACNGKAYPAALTKLRERRTGSFAREGRRGSRGADCSGLDSQGRAA